MLLMTVAYCFYTTYLSCILFYNESSQKWETVWTVFVISFSECVKIKIAKWPTTCIMYNIAQVAYLYENMYVCAGRQILEILEQTNTWSIRKVEVLTGYYGTATKRSITQGLCHLT